MLAILFCGLLAPAQPFQTEYWVGTNATTGFVTNTWTNVFNWVNGSGVRQGITTNLDALHFGGGSALVPAANKAPQNITGVGYTNNMPFWSLTFETNGFILGGTGIVLSNSITDNAGANSNAIPLILGANVTFANNSGSGWTNTQSGTVQLQTNTLTINGSAPFFLTGAINSTNGGSLVINNSSVTRLQVANIFGTNVIQITNLFTGNGTYNATTNIYTNYFAVVGPGGFTNYSYVTNIVSSTNGTTAYTTNTYAKVVDAVRVNSGTLQLNNSGALPSGATVGNFYLDGTMDLNGMSPTVNGLEGSGSIDNFTNSGLFTVTLGNGNSNAVFSGVIGTAANNGATSGQIGVTKIGWGNQTFAGGNEYAGPTLINQGKLTLTGSGTLGFYSSILTIGSGAVMDVSALNGLGGYIPSTGITVAAGTPTKPYTNYLGSYDPFYPTYTVTLSGTNNVLTFGTNVVSGVTNVVITTNFVSLSFTTNSIISIINADVNGDFLVPGGGAISPITSIAPGIATWAINGDLTLDNSLSFGKNRVNFLLNDTTTPGGGTNDLITVSGTLYIGDELDFVITPKTGSLAAGTYTLIKSGTYVPHGNTSVDGDSAPANLVLIEARGLSGDTVTASGNNIVLTSLGGTATPGSIVWAGTPALNNWDVHLSQNWKLSGSPDYFYPQDNVTFDDTGVGTVVMPVVVSPGSTTFNNNLTNYTFTADASVFITGPGGLTKNGSGTVTLQNPNSFTGDVTVNGGTLALGYYPGGGFRQHTLYNAVPSGNLILGGGTVIQNTTAEQGPETSFQNVTINPGASQISQQGRGSNELPVYNISNNVTRVVGGVLNVTTSGRNGSHAGLFFSSTNSPDGTNDYGVNGIVGGYATYNLNDWLFANTANTEAQGGNMSYRNYQMNNNPASWGSTSNVLVGLSSGNTATINVGSSTTINSLRLTNAGPVVVNISGGQSLTLSSGGILSPFVSSGVFLNSINGGTLKGAPGADLIVLNQNTTAGSSLTIGSVIADNGGATGLTTAGAGKTILTGNNTYTGPTYINNGYQGGTPGTLQIGANGTSGSIASSSAVVDNGSLAFNRSDNTSVSGVISGIGSLTKLSAGVLTLTANNTLSGLVTISSGTLQLGNGGAAGSVSNAVGIVDNATLVFDNNNTVGYSKPISGFGSLVQFGSGNLIIATNETYSGNTIVSNGTMTLTATGYLTNTVSIKVNAGAVLDVSALGGGLTLRSATAQSLSGSGTVNGSITTASGTTLSPGNSVGTLTINNNLALSGGNFLFDLPTSGPTDRINVGGTLTENSGTVITIVSGGTLANGVYPLIHATGGISGSAANLSLFGFNQSGQIGVLTNETAGGQNNLSLLVYSGTIPALAWVGSGNGGASDIWNASANNWTNVLSGGPLTAYANPDFALFDDTISFNNPVDIQVAVSPTAITVNSTNLNYVLGANTGSAQKITGGASLVKNGPGTLTLQTTNDYLGTTVINAGVVQLGNNTAQAEDGLLGSGGAITLNGTLVVSNFATETIAGPISGAGQLVQQGVGKLVLAGNNSGYSGGIWATNYLQMGNGFTGTLGTGPVTNNRTLLLNVGPTPASIVNVPANISGSGGITNLGPGIVTLSGNNTYAGSTVVNIGTLQLGSANALPSTTAVFMDDSNGGSVGTLDLNGQDATIASLQGANTGQGTAGLVACQIVNNGVGAGVNTLTIGGGTSTTFSGQILDNNNGGSGLLALLVTNHTSLQLNATYNNLNVNSFPNLFSGGIIISNASVSLGYNGNTANPANEGGASAGIGTITLLGSGIDVTNPITRFPTNCAMLFASDNNASTSPTYNSQIGVVNVPTGATGVIFGPVRGLFTCTLTGGGTLLYEGNYVRDQFGGDWSGFTGTIILASYYGTGDNPKGFGYTGPLGFPNATLFMGVSNLVFMNIYCTTAVGTGAAFPIGALAGGDNTCSLRGSSQNAGANVNYTVGSLNASTAYGGQMSDAVGLRKVGTGTLTLTNNLLNYTGQTVVSNGTLAFVPLGNNPGAFNALTNNYLVSSPIVVVSPGVLDVTGMGGTLYLGHSANNQTIFGNGTLTGSLQTMAGTNTVVSPGQRAGDTNTYPGNLTISGTATFNNSSTFQMSVDASSSPTYDSVTAGTLTINQAALVVRTNGNLTFPGGTSNVFRFFNAAVTVSAGSGITNITVPILPSGEYWVTNLTLDGSMAIVNTNSAVDTSPFPVSSSFDGANLTLIWPQNHTGYHLQAQTNALGIGLSNNWTTIDAQFSPAANTTNKVVIPVTPGNPSVFYRLTYP